MQYINSFYPVPKGWPHTLLYSYMLIPLNMYLRESKQPLPDTIKAGILPQLVTAGLMLLTLYFGIFFTPLSDFAHFAVTLFGNQLY